MPSPVAFLSCWGSTKLCHLANLCSDKFSVPSWIQGQGKRLLGPLARLVHFSSSLRKAFTVRKLVRCGTLCVLNLLLFRRVFSSSSYLCPPPPPTPLLNFQDRVARHLCVALSWNSFCRAGLLLHGWD